MPFSRFLSISCLIFIVSLLISLGFILLEFSYGNGDGIWGDLDIRLTTYTILLFQCTLVITIYILMYGPKTINAIGTSLLMTALLLFGIELACRQIVSQNTDVQKKGSPKPKPFVREDYKNSFLENDILGIIARPNWKLSWTPVKDGIRYDTIKISIDSLSRRITPANDSVPKSKYALFFGCSYTYGDGVSDDQTLPYFFQSYSKGYQSYNYGFLAYSPLHMLARLQHFNIRKQVAQSQGFAVYSFINDNLDRIIPATRWIEITDGKFPYFDEDRLATDGTFESRHRIYTYLVSQLRGSGIKQILKWSYPKKHTRAHYERLVKIIKQSQVEYTGQFKNPNFFVVIFPGNSIPAELRRILKDQKIKVLDYSQLLDIKKQMLPFDGNHPTSAVYKLVAQRLSKDLDSLVQIE